MSKRLPPPLSLAVRRLLLVLACCWLAPLPTLRAAAATPKLPLGTDAAPELFEGGWIPRLTITIADADVATLANYQWRGRWGGGAADEDDKKRPTVQVTVREGLKIYTNVALHLKGSAGSFRPIFDRPGMTLNFNKFAKGQTFHGLERMSLNNSVQDPTYLSEKICRELYAQAGVPVPRATHAVVTLNDRPLGLYVLLEACNKQFLSRTFGNNTGHLYDGGFVHDIDDGVELASGKNPDDRSDIERLVAAAQAAPDQRLAELEKILDVDRFLTLLAMDVILCNTDGYALNRNNYRIYHDTQNDRLAFMPHGLDQMFGTFRADPSMPIFPRAEGMVARAIWQSTEGRRRYRERLAALVDRHFDTDAITRRVHQLAEQIRPLLAQRKSGRASQFERTLTALKDRIVDRGESLRQQLSARNQSLPFATDGTARPEGWKPALDFGKPQLRMLNDPNEAPELQLDAGSRSSVGAWTTRVLLEPGRYRFTGRARCRGVVPEPGDRRGGALLRAGTQRATQRLVGDAEWTEISVEFDADDGAEGVDLRCELRAAQGQAWFDPQSLRLKRL